MKTFYTVYNTEHGFFKGCDEPDMIITHGGYDLPEAQELAEKLAQDNPESISVLLQVVKVCTCPKPQPLWNIAEPVKKYRLILHEVDFNCLIDTIKMIRTYTLLGLKEAKDIVDKVRYNGSTEVLLPDTVTEEHLDGLVDYLIRVNAKYTIEECIGHSDLWKVVR